MHTGSDMWRTSCGERVLGGKERSLFVHGAACLLDYLLEDDEADLDCTLDTGVDPFDHLESDARIVLLRDIVQALTDAAMPAPELTALNEAAVHAVFQFIRAEVEMEIDCESLEEGPELDESFSGYDPFYWRTLVLVAYLEGRGSTDVNGDGEDDLSPTCTEMEEWDLQLECLADQILWDRDWELDEIMDASPEQAQALKRQLGIDEDYFLATAAVPVDGDVKEAMTFLRRLAEAERQA